ncbi:ComEA family DNA-binding protein [Evtepia sp.]|uniref:ComEA family DNA-binding protein n=1 Tax=Evtepia sp. TaxID=2773933 RepID=UPI002A7FE554|nr:ComEA family DNA-binding protein [Evtepia sp.]MDY4430655.1 ComEA family DNA-binding protein [Evtepia sp.]
MAGKFLKISKLEGIVLLLTLLFVGGTLLWFAFSQPGEGVTVVTERQDPEPQVLTETPDTPEAPGLLEGEVLNLNTASQTELTRLPGIGETKAAAIVAWRQEHGSFQTVEDLMAVDGIGEKTLENLRPYVTVGEPAAEEGGN